MKDLVSCFSEHAVRISGAANAATGTPEPGGGARAAAVSKVATVYRSRLSASGKELLVEVLWLRAPRHLHRKKGRGMFSSGSCVGVFWDYAAALYTGPGPKLASGL